MATITSVGSGNWGTAGTWDAGVPADGDDVIIANTHTVTFNVDQSAFVTGVKVTVNSGGILDFTKTTGNYKLMLKNSTGAFVINGTCNIGVVGDAIPATAIHIITSVGTYKVTGTGMLTAVGTNPTNRVIKTSGSEAIGQTRIEVDTDVTGDHWHVGDAVGIGSEERIIADIQATYIDITVGLTAAKSAGTPVYLIDRNIRWRNTSTAGRTFTCKNTQYNTSINAKYGSEGNPSLYYGCVWKSDGYVSNTPYNLYFENCIVYNSSFGVNYSTKCYLINCTAFYGLNENNDIYYGTVPSSGIFNNCRIVGAGLTYYSFGTFNNIDLSALSINTPKITTYNCKLPSTISNYNGLKYGEICENFDVEQVTGAYKAYCSGGYVISQNTVKPSGYSNAYLHSMNNYYNGSYCWHRQTISVLAGQKVNIEVQLRKSASTTYLPRVYLTNISTFPIYDTTNVLDTFTMTDSIDTWETDTFAIDNSSGTKEILYKLYFVAYKTSTFDVYSAYKIIPESSGTSSVKILPLGRVGL